MSESHTKVLIQNTKWIYISKIATQILNVIATILVIRKLPIDVFGTYNLLLYSFVVFQIIALSSIISVFNRYIPELIANREYLKFKKFIRRGFCYSSMLFTFLMALLYIQKATFASFFNIENFDKYLLAFFIFNYANFIKILIDTALKSLLLNKKVAIITIINTALRTLLYIILLDKLDVNLLLYIEIFLAILFIMQGLYVYYKYISHFDYITKPEVQTPVTFKRIKRYGLLSFVNELGVGIVGKTSDYFIVAALSNPFHVGLFAFAHRIYSMVYKVLPIKDFQTVLRPLFFKKYINNYNIEDFRRMYAFMVKVLIPLYVLPAIYFIFFGKQIINIIFESKYSESYWITIILLSSNFFLAFFYPLGLTIMLKERMEFALYSKVVVFFSIFAGIFGMKYLGVLGVAIASLLGDFFKNIILLFFMRKYPEIKYRFKDYKNYLIMLVFITPFIILHYFDFSLLLLVFWSLVFIVYSTIIFMIFHPFIKYDIDLINKVASSSPILLKLKEVIIQLFGSLIKLRPLS